jgi:hypothetical protein
VLERQGLSEHPHSTALKANLATLHAPSGRDWRANPAFAPPTDVTASGAGLSASRTPPPART